MRLHELTLPKDRVELNNTLLSAGYAVIGAGYAADVYAKADSPYVLKVFHISDTAYEAYINMVASHQDNPHFPKIRGKLRITPEYKAVRLERLEPYTGTERNLWNIHQYLHAKLKNQQADKYKEGLPDSLIAACDLIATIPDVRIHDTRSATRSLGVDMKAANVMMRGSTLVLIDPVS